MNVTDSFVPRSTTPDSPVGVVGLGVMGANLARNLAKNLDAPIPVYDINAQNVVNVVEENPDLPLEGFTDIQGFVEALASPRVVLLLVPAGGPVDSAVAALGPYLQEGDIVIDGGNSHFQDTARRVEHWDKAGVHFLGMGTSGGEQGALHGPSLMAGGDPSVWSRIKPVFEPIAAQADDGDPCVALVGSGASGHFTKMVHNGIEYADLQLIAEAYSLLRASGKSTQEVSETFAEWNTGDRRSYLLDSAVEVLGTADPLTDVPLVKVVSDAAKGKGTGAWTVIAGAELGVSVSIIADAFFARSTSSAQSERSAWLSATHRQEVSANLAPETIRDAYFSARLLAYQQGMNLLQEGSQSYDWGVNLVDVVKTWRAGCIIRAGFLGRMRELYVAEPDDPMFITKDPFKQQVLDALPALQQTVASASLAGVPVPATAAALNQLVMLRTGQLPTAVVQLLRDYFGSHTFERADRPGNYHVDWESGRGLREV